MGGYSSEGKSLEDIIKDMEGMKQIPREWLLPDAMSAAIQVKLVDHLCQSIQAGGKDFTEASSALKESIDQFRRSNEKTSKVLIGLTVVIALAALVQALTLILK